MESLTKGDRNVPDQVCWSENEVKPSNGNGCRRMPLEMPVVVMTPQHYLIPTMTVPFTHNQQRLLRRCG